MILKKEILLQLKTRYFLQKGQPGSAEFAWMACHGYGQLASYFIKNFESLSGKHIIVAPEGLNRFYLDGLERRVGATWMTKEDRISDIENYLLQLDQIWKKEIRSISVRTRIAFGFSQGTATITRWLTNNRPPFEVLVLWAGCVAHDIDLYAHKDYLNQLKIIYAIGSEDPFLKTEHVKTERERWGKIGISPQILNFDGGHQIDQKALKALVSTL